MFTEEETNLIFNVFKDVTKESTNDEVSRLAKKMEVLEKMKEVNKEYTSKLEELQNELKELDKKEK